MLHDVVLDIEQGQIVTLIGANGAGKTTLLKTISGLLRPGAGSITFDGKSIVRRPPHKIVGLGISHVPEGRAILKRMTVIDNLRMGAYVRSDARDRGRHRGGLRALSRAVRAAPADRRHAQRRRAADAGDRPRACRAPATAAARRAFARSCAQDRHARFFSRCASSRTRARPSSWSSRTRARRCSVADHGYVMERGRIVFSGSGEELLNMPEVQRTYLGQSAA